MLGFTSACVFPKYLCNYRNGFYKKKFLFETECYENLKLLN